MNASPGINVLLAGATGLVGRECLDLILADPAFAHVTAIVRRPLPPQAGFQKLTRVTIDFDRLGEHPAIFYVDQIFCALGTTMRKAGSQSAFRRVDFEYPLRIAELGLARGAGHFLLISSMGADSRSPVFYNRVKGELEDAITKLGYRSLTIVRPSLLLGDRVEWRLGEEVAQRFGFLMPSRFRPIPVRTVARALVRAAREGVPGRRVIDNRELQTLPR